METRREMLKDAIREYLGHWVVAGEGAGYEHACNLADIVFYTLGIPEHEQDKVPHINFPRRLPVVRRNGKQYFLDRRLEQYRNMENPHDVIDFRKGLQG